MKTILSVFSFMLLMNVSFAQLKTIEKTFPVIEGCQKIDSKNQKAVKECFDKKTQELIQAELKNYAEELTSVEAESLKIKVRYNTTQDGKVGRINVLNSSDKAFADVVKKAIEQVSTNLVFVKPSFGEDGEPITSVVFAEYQFKK